MDNTLQNANQNVFDYQSAKDGGFSDQDIQDYISRHPNVTVVNKPSVGQQPTDVTAPQQQSGGGGILGAIADYLPTIGGVVGGLAGSELGPGALATAGAGSAAGEGLKELIKGKGLSAKDIAIQGGLGAAGEGVGGLISKVGGGVISKFGGKLADLGEETAARGLRPSPSQQANFLEDTGQNLGSFLSDHGLAGQDAEGINKYIAGKQDAFDSVAKSPDLNVAPEDVVDGFASEIQKLRSSILPADHAKADVLQHIGLNFIGKYGDQEAVPAAELTTLRRTIDNGISENTFDSAVANPMKSTRNILQGSLQDAADKAGVTANGKSLKEAGQELNHLYSLRDIANRQQFLGKGTKPIGIGDIPGFLFGGGVGSVLGATGPGAVIGAVGQHVVNSPKVIGLASKLMLAGGKKLVAGELPPMVGSVAGQALAHTLQPAFGVPVGNLGGNANQNNNGGEQLENANMGAPTNQDNSNNPEPHGGSVSNGISNVNGPDENGNYTLPTLDSANNPIPMAYSLQDAMADQAKAGSNPILLDAIAQRYNMSKAAAESYQQSHALPDTEREFMTRAEQTNAMFNELRGLIKKVGTGPLNEVPGVGYVRSQTDPDYARMVALMQQLRGQSVKAIEGGRPSNFDLQALNAMPGANESKASALAKLNQAQALLVQQYKRNLPAYSLNVGGTNMPDMTSPQQAAPSYTMPDMYTTGQ